MKKERVKIKVVSQGTPKLTHRYGYELKGDGEAVCFFVDIKQIYCTVSSYISDGLTPGVTIDTTKDTHGFTEDDKTTEIQFPEFEGWYIHCVGIGKYELAVALTKND